MIFPTVNIVYAPAVLISQYMAAVKRFRASGCIDTAAAFSDSLYIITYMLRVVKRFFEISQDFFGRYGVRSCAQCPGANRPRRLHPAARSVAWFRYCGLFPAAEQPVTKARCFRSRRNASTGRRSAVHSRNRSTGCTAARCCSSLRLSSARRQNRRLCST